MKNEIIYNKWSDFINEYKEYFKTNKELWYESLQQLILYIDKYRKRPSSGNKNEQINKLAGWLMIQNRNFKNKINIMKNNNDIYNKFN